MDKTTRPIERTFALANGRIAFGGRILDGWVLIVRDGKIDALVRPQQLPDLTVYDCQGHLISPGLIDSHTHGCFGNDFGVQDETALHSLLGTYLRHGVTVLTPTFAAMETPQFIRQVSWLQDHVPFDVNLPQVVGVYYESQFIDHNQRGALNSESIRVPLDEDFAQYAEIIPFLKIFMLAPEKPGGRDLIRFFRRHGVTLSMGHTSASADQTEEAILSGVTRVTHLWRNMPLMFREPPFVRLSVPETTQKYETVYIEIISDGWHVEPALVEYSYRMFGSDRMILITDSTQAAGLPDGSHFSIGVQNDFLVKSGVGWRRDLKSFAGSAVMLNEVLRITTQNTAIPLAEVIKMATLTPARSLGIERFKGSLEPGKDADIVIFDADFTPQQVFICGELAFGEALNIQR